MSMNDGNLCSIDRIFSSLLCHLSRYNPWIAADKENILSLYYELALAYDHPYLLGGIEQVLHCLYPSIQQICILQVV